MVDQSNHCFLVVRSNNAFGNVNNPWLNCYVVEVKIFLVLLVVSNLSLFLFVSNLGFSFSSPRIISFRYAASWLYQYWWVVFNKTSIPPPDSIPNYDRAFRSAERPCATKENQQLVNLPFFFMLFLVEAPYTNKLVDILQAIWLNIKLLAIY